MNSNTNLNSNTQKQCISMYATLNPYIDFFILEIIKCLNKLKKTLQSLRVRAS
jgi:hypothetical protein